MKSNTFFDTLTAMLCCFLCDVFVYVLDLAAFREIFSKAKHVAILTGAGVSAESGVPTFRGAGGYWRKWQAQVSHHRTSLNLLIWVHFSSVLYENLAFQSIMNAFSESASQQ